MCLSAGWLSLPFLLCVLFCVCLFCEKCSRPIQDALFDFGKPITEFDADTATPDSCCVGLLL